MIACNFKLRSKLSVNEWWWCGSWIHQYVSIMSIHLSLLQQQLLLWFQLCCLRLHLCASIWPEEISICCNYNVRLEKNFFCDALNLATCFSGMYRLIYPRGALTFGTCAVPWEFSWGAGAPPSEWIKRIINVVLSDVLIKAIVAIY